MNRTALATRVMTELDHVRIDRLLARALLGRRRGDLVEWTTPSGATHRLRIVELLFQPEASGDFTL